MISRNYQTLNRSNLRTALVACVVALLMAPVSQAGVFVDPTIVTGADAIDPTTGPNAGDLNASGVVVGAPDKAFLTSQTGFGVVQDFLGFQGNPSGPDPRASINYFSFTDSAIPDVRFTTTSYNSSGGGVSNNFTTSGLSATGGTAALGDSNQFIGSGGFLAGQASVIEFGTYNEGTMSFNPNKAVGVVGFMISQNSNAIARTWTVTFKDIAANVLETQTVEANANSAFLFGHVATEAASSIARIELAIIGGGDAGTFLDDFGFAVGTGIAPPQPGDVNFDGAVNLVDYELIRANFRKTVADPKLGDLTGPNGLRDGVVDFYDFGEWKANVSALMAAQAVGVPEPASVVLMTLAGLAMGLQRRRR